MKNFTKFFGSLVALLFVGAANAQCPAGQVDVTVDVTTDTWGYEAYWEYTPTGDACGTNTLGTFGNTVVGCAGGGAQVATTADPGIYPNNTTTTESLGCLTIGDCFDIHYVDDYGDGGASFQMYYDGTAGEAFADPGGNGATFTFCATSAIQYDAGMDNVVTNPYTMMPLTHVVNAVALEGTMINNGLMDVTDATITADVMIGAASQFSATSTPVTLASGATQTETFTSYTPAGMGLHEFWFTTSITEADEVASNDTAVFYLDVNDSTMARDNGIATGSLGIGAGLGQNAYLGQVFRAEANENMTSATALFSGPTMGDSTRFVVYDMNGGAPNTIIAQTAAYTFAGADTNGVLVNLMFEPALPVTAGTDYMVAVAEYNNNVTLATDASNLELGSTWVNWDGNPNGAWSNSEDFGFNVQYILRANFNDNTGIEEADISNNVSVYPNPSKGNFNVAVDGVNASDVNIVVTDVDGRIVTTQAVGAVYGSTEIAINLNGVESGVYFVQINADGKSAVERVTVAK